MKNLQFQFWFLLEKCACGEISIQLYCTVSCTIHNTFKKKHPMKCPVSSVLFETDECESDFYCCMFFFFFVMVVVHIKSLLEMKCLLNCPHVLKKSGLIKCWK